MKTRMAGIAGVLAVMMTGVGGCGDGSESDAEDSRLFDGGTAGVEREARHRTPYRPATTEDEGSALTSEEHSDDEDDECPKEEEIEAGREAAVEIPCDAHAERQSLQASPAP
jgi:hypothetical protein